MIGAKVIYDTGNNWNCWAVIVFSYGSYIECYLPSKPTKKQLRKIKKDFIRIMKLDEQES